MIGEKLLFSLDHCPSRWIGNSEKWIRGRGKCKNFVGKSLITKSPYLSYLHFLIIGMLRIFFDPLCYTYSMVRVTAVVTWPGLVHITPIVFGFLSILDRTRCLRNTAGALCLSRVNVVLITALLWSEISTSFQPNFTDIQNSSLLAAVLGEGRYTVDVKFPISNTRLKECHLF